MISLDCVLNRMEEAEGKALFEKWESTLMTALDSLPKDENGLIWNDPQNPHSPYGFMDCIVKTGTLMKESLLVFLSPPGIRGMKHICREHYMQAK